MRRRQFFSLIVLLGLVATSAGCQTLGSIPFVPHGAGLPAQSE